MEYDPQEEQKRREQDQANQALIDAEIQGVEAQQEQQSAATAAPDVAQSAPAPSKTEQPAPIQQQSKAEAEPPKDGKKKWDEEAYQRGEYDDGWYWDRIDDRGQLRPVTTSPYVKEDGTLDQAKLSRHGMEKDLDTPAALLDFAIDSLNFVAGWAGFDKPVPSLPKFENELAQSSREIQSILLPTLIGQGAVIGGINNIGAVRNSKMLTATVPKAIGTNLVGAGTGATVGAISSTSEEANASATLKENFPRTWGWIPDWLATSEKDSPDVKRRKNIVEGVLFDGVFGTFEAAFALTRKSNLNSKVFNWVPESEKGKKWFDKNLPRSTPEEAKEFYMDVELEDVFAKNPDADFNVEFDAVSSRWDSMDTATKKHWRHLTNENSPQISLYGSEKAQADALDELGQFNLEKGMKDVEVDVPIQSNRDYYIDESRKVNPDVEDFDFGKQFDELEDVEKGRWQEALDTNKPTTKQITKELNLDEPVFGVHDVWGYRESGIRQVDDLGIIAGSVDAARIQGNIDSIYGRVAGMISDGAIRYVLDGRDPLAIDQISRGLSKTLTDAGQYGYKTNGGKFVPFEKIQQAGDNLANALYGTEPEEMVQILDPFLAKPSKAGIRALNTEGGKAVDAVLKRYYQDMLSPDYLRAQGLLSTSLAGQAADTAMGVRLMSGTEAYARGSEQVLDRIEYLMNLKTSTDFAKADAVKLGNIWKQLNTWGPKANINKESRRVLRQWQDTRLASEDAVQQIRQQTARTVSTMRAIGREHPALMEPFLFAYEMSDGAINSVNSLNRFYNNSTGVWKKAFMDGASDVPSVYNKAFWGNIYNNLLTTMGTPIKAVYSGAVLTIERPIATGVGALLQGDMETIRRGWYMYSGAMDTLQRGAEYSKRVWAKSGIDPYMPGQRENINNQNVKQVELMDRMATAADLEGKPAASIFVENVKTQMDMANHPWLRAGTRGMSAFDGWEEAVVGSWESRARAFDKLTNGGQKPLTQENLRQASKQIYSDMFDANGMMTDSQVKYAAGEISFNLDSGFNDGLNSLIEKVPVVKPFMMFTKTPINALAYTASSNPIGAFWNKLNKFALPFDQMDGIKVQELLDQRGVKYTPDTIKAEYMQLRAELYGRKAIGVVATGLGTHMFMNDRLRGDGLYDKQKQSLRRAADWEKRTYKGWDGKWYSYDGMGAISDWIAMTANIMDNGLDFGASGKGTLRSQDVGESLRAAGFVISAALTDRTQLSNMEPLMDILRGDPGAMNRWAGAFLPSATIPGANALNEFYRLLDDSKKVVDNNLISIMTNRTPLKGALPTRFDWIDGDVVNEPTDFWTRAWNNYTPWKVTGAVSPEKQFLIDIGFDARPSITTDGSGTPYSSPQQSELLSLIGERGLFKEAIIEEMKSKEAQAFIAEFREAQSRGLKPDPKTFAGVQSRLQDSLTAAVKYARYELTDRPEIEAQSYKQNMIDQQLKLGNVEEAQKADLQTFGMN